MLTRRARIDAGRVLALPALQADQVAAHPVGIDLAARQVHVGLADQSPLVGGERHPLGEHVVGVGQPRAAERLGQVGERHAVLVQQLAASRARRRRSACADRSGRRRGHPPRAPDRPARPTRAGSRGRGTSPSHARPRTSAAAHARAARRGARAPGHSPSARRPRLLAAQQLAAARERAFERRSRELPQQHDEDNRRRAERQRHRG